MLSEQAATKTTKATKTGAAISPAAITKEASARLIARASLPRPAAAAFVFALALASGALGSGCSPGEALEADADGPGSTVIAGVIACKEDSDCKTGEACGQGFCQMKRCSDLTYDSLPPFGSFGYAAVDRAFVAGTDTTALQVFSAHTPSGKREIRAGEAPLDVAGGNLTGVRPETLAFITSGSGVLKVLGSDGAAKPIALGWQAKRLATGDVNGDGIDEIVVLSEGSKYAICDATKGSCKESTLSTIADDVAVGDVDGDGLGEVLFVGNHTLTIVNVNPEATGEPEKTSQPVAPALAHLTAGDLDGDGIAEIIGSEIGGAFSEDKLYVFRVGGTLVQEAEFALGYSTGNEALDVAYARVNDKPAIGVLSNATTLRLFSYSTGTLTQSSQVPIANGRARRLAVADVHGRSAAVRLKSGPALEVGPPVPIAVLTLPPYSTAHSAGPSSATLGNTEESSTSESQGSSKTTSVSLMLGLGVSAGAAGLSGSVTAYLTRSWSQTTSRSKAVSKSLSVGNSYTLTAEPQVDGYNSGGVVLAGGCYHRYDYILDDPAKLVGEAASELTTFVPVGGETSLWSTNRYNALVDALGDGRLPKVNITAKLGNVSSYPSTPVTLDGKPIPKADNVFPKSPITRPSDVGTVGFSLTANENTTNTDASSFNYGESKSIAASVNIRFINASAQYTTDTNWGLDQSYSVTVGTSASFSGQVAPVRDDPGTPANEASIYGYSFQPIVYRHHFKDAEGKSGAFYVLTYTAGK